VNPRPVYPRIAEAIRVRISKGEFPPGSQVPSEGTLCAEFGVSRNTLRRALTELESDGLIAAVPGKGRIVRGRQEAHGRPGELLPAYRRIAADLRERIERGEHAPGARLPSEAALVRHHHTSRDTVRRALASLRAAGLVTVVQGKGWFVRGDTPEANRTSQDVPARVSPATGQRQ